MFFQENSTGVFIFLKLFFTQLTTKGDIQVGRIQPAWVAQYCKSAWFVILPI